MIVVSDTSPLNYLVLVRHNHVLPALFDRVVAPPAVTREMLHSGAPAMVQAWASSPPKWLEVVAPAVIDPTLSLGPFLLTKTYWLAQCCYHGHFYAR